MKKPHYTLLLIFFFLTALIGGWMGLATINEISDDTGFLYCIPEKTSDELCTKLRFYKAVFWIGVIPLILLLIFRKRIITK